MAAPDPRLVEWLYNYLKRHDHPPSAEELTGNRALMDALGWSSVLDSGIGGFSEDQEADDIVQGFIAQMGRPPTVVEAILLIEARASARPDGATRTVE